MFDMATAPKEPIDEARPESETPEQAAERELAVALGYGWPEDHPRYNIGKDQDTSDELKSWFNMQDYDRRSGARPRYNYAEVRRDIKSKAEREYNFKHPRRPPHWNKAVALYLSAKDEIEGLQGGLSREIAQRVVEYSSKDQRKAFLVAGALAVKRRRNGRQYRKVIEENEEARDASYWGASNARGSTPYGELPFTETEGEKLLDIYRENPEGLSQEIERRVKKETRIQRVKGSLAGVGSSASYDASFQRVSATKPIPLMSERANRRETNWSKASLRQIKKHQRKQKAEQQEHEADEELKKNLGFSKKSRV